MAERIPAAALGLRWTPTSLFGDSRLVNLASRGEPRAFTAIYERYHQELYRYCRVLLGTHDDAQDALQSTMASVMRALPGESRSIALRPWLYRIAHNEAMTLLRQRHPHAELERVPEHSQPYVELPVEERERLRQLVGDLEALPERQRAALTMRELSGFGYAEIAAMLDTSEGAARQTVYEARAALQDLSEGREMECEHARELLSAGDRRVLRGRRLRAHLRSCDGCTGFELAIAQRRSDLQAIAPALPAAAASSILAALAGGEATKGAAVSAGLIGGGAGKAALATSGALKVAGSVAAVVAIGTGIGVATNAVDLPFGGGDDPGVVETAEVPGAGPLYGGPPARAGDARGAKKDRGEGRGGARRGGEKNRSSAAGGGEPGPRLADRDVAVTSAPGVNAPTTTTDAPPSGPTSGGPPANPAPPAHPPRTGLGNGLEPTRPSQAQGNPASPPAPGAPAGDRSAANPGGANPHAGGNGKP